SAVSAASNVSIVRFNRSVSMPCGSNHSCSKNFVTVLANGCTGSSSHVLPVVTSRYDGIDSIKGIMIGSLSSPSTLNVSLASCISINIVILLILGFPTCWDCPILVCPHYRTAQRSEEHTSELQSRFDLVCRLL